MPERDFSACLLMGGQSRRFGCDKSKIRFPGQVRPLWLIQLDKLRALRPGEIFLSGTETLPPPDAKTRIQAVPDLIPSQGPLGGIHTALTLTRTRFVLVLAVDMPLVSREALSRLMNQAIKSGRGLVPLRRNRWEPLLAVYPKTLAPLAEQRLCEGRLSVQDFVSEARRRCRISPWSVAENEESLFTNLNRPEDLKNLDHDAIPAAKTGFPD